MLKMKTQEQKQLAFETKYSGASEFRKRFLEKVHPHRFSLMEKNIEIAKLKEEKAELAEIVESKNEFLKTMAHDLRSPLGAVNNWMMIIRESFDEMNKEEILKRVASLEATTRNTLELLERRLAWLRKGAKPAPTKIAVGELVEKTARLLAANLEIKGITYSQNIPDGACAFCDENMTQQIVQNLLSNAIKFTSEKGKIAIEARETGECLYVSIMDNGVGIAPEKLETLFTNGKTTSGTAGERGTGLGLIMVGEMVKLQGGTISAESRVGGGSTFAFTVPLWKE